MALAELKLEWQGREYVVPHRRIMGAILAAESVVSLPEMAADAARSKGARIAMAYGAALRYAGAAVEDFDVYTAMYGEDGEKIQASLAALLDLMLPPPAMVREDTAPAGKSEAAVS